MEGTLCVRDGRVKVEGGGFSFSGGAVDVSGVAGLFWRWGWFSEDRGIRRWMLQVMWIRLRCERWYDSIAENC